MNEQEFCIKVHIFYIYTTVFPAETFTSITLFLFIFTQRRFEIKYFNF